MHHGKILELRKHLQTENGSFYCISISWTLTMLKQYPTAAIWAFTQATHTQQLHHTCQNCVYQSPPALDVISCVQQHGDLFVPRTSTSTYGPRSFAVSEPSVWNKLPATLRVSPTLGQFQSKLKAVLFRSAYETGLGAFVTA